METSFNVACTVGDSLELMDITNPSKPLRVGEYDTVGDARAVVLSGSYAYVADGRGLVVLEMPPFFKSVSRRDRQLDLTWEGWGSARLQRATSLTNPDWQDQPGSELANSAILSITTGGGFFRLHKP